MCEAAEQKKTYFPSTAATTLHAILCSYSALSMRSRRSFRLFKFIMNTYVGGDSSESELSDSWWRGLKKQTKEGAIFLQTPSSISTSLLTSSKPILSGCFLGTRTYLEGITGGFRTARWEGGWVQKMAAVMWAGGTGRRNREAGCKGEELHLRTHRWPLGGSARSCRTRPAKCCGLAAARAKNRRSLCCTHTFGPLRKAHKARAISSRSIWDSRKLRIVELWNTCHASRVGKHNDVIKRPAVLWVRWVKGQLPGCFLSEVYQHGGVHHGNCKAAFSQLLPDGYVGWGALVVALRRQPEGNFYS